MCICFNHLAFGIPNIGTNVNYLVSWLVSIVVYNVKLSLTFNKTCALKCMLAKLNGCTESQKLSVGNAENARWWMGKYSHCLKLCRTCFMTEKTFTLIVNSGTSYYMTLPSLFTGNKTMLFNEKPISNFKQKMYKMFLVFFIIIIFLLSNLKLPTLQQWCNWYII